MLSPPAIGGQQSSLGSACEDSSATEKYLGEAEKSNRSSEKGTGPFSGCDAHKELEIEVDRHGSPSPTPPSDAPVTVAGRHPRCGFVPDFPCPINFRYPFGLPGEGEGQR